MTEEIVLRAKDRLIGALYLGDNRLMLRTEIPGENIHNTEHIPHG